MNSVTVSPKISIVIPVYNAAGFIRETVASVLNQTLHALEVIVVNDGSKDDSISILRELKPTDARIVVLDKPNSGVSDSRNRGVALASAPYIAFLDADDLFLPENLAKKVAYLDAHPTVGLCFSAHESFDSHTGRTLDTLWPDTEGLLPNLLRLARPHGLLPSSVVIRREILEAVGGFDTQLSTSADWDLWVRLAKITHFHGLPEILVRYRIHPAQMHLNIAQMERDMVYSFQKLKRAGGYFEAHSPYHQCFARLAVRLSGSYFHHTRRKDKAVLWALRSLLSDPAAMYAHVFRRGRRAPKVM